MLAPLVPDPAPTLDLPRIDGGRLWARPMGPPAAPSTPSPRRHARRQLRRAGLEVLRFGAHLEARIEQGPVPEAGGCTIGVVTGALGQRWSDVVVTGQEAHAGPTPMELRRDTLQAATRLMQPVDAIARAEAPHARSTVGCVHVFPNSRNTIPGRVPFTVDFRHTDDAGLQRMDAALRAAAQALQAARVREAAARHGLPHRDIVHDAGHAAAHVVRQSPTAMTCVPCKDGISHDEIEDAWPEHLAAGCHVLLDVLLATAGRAA